MSGKGIYLAYLDSLMVEDFNMDINRNAIIITRANGEVLSYSSISAFLKDWKVLEHDRNY
jgi:hypothetical protein